MARHKVSPEHFLMVGNSLKSDVLPCIEAGGAAIHIPYVTTWAHEHVAEDALTGKTFTRLETIRGLQEWLGQ